MTARRARISAGLMMYRRREGRIEVFLAHPGGPYFKNKDEGAWSIPKGEVEGVDGLLETALREFEEETGIAPPRDPLIELGQVKQRGGKVVIAWAFEGDLAQGWSVTSNTFPLEWPPGSGRIQDFPEIDRAEFFDLELARRKINRAQVALIDALVARLSGDRPE
jgi:predicted NUDIX family NTP pyrophosphohydrolase